MAAALPGLLRFEEAYQPRPWGGRRLAAALQKPLPDGPPIGEAWLVSDHPVHTSVVADGPCAGQSLAGLMARASGALLGPQAPPTATGRFPLLLKLLDARETLSIQVHPDDALAAALGEPDGGKTEMWHVLDAATDARLFLGTPPLGPDETLPGLLASERLVPRIPQCVARPGENYFVPAGTLHAIGAGLLIAEIQQNSDLTYRVHDWGRVDAEGRPRALHLDKAAAATRHTGVDARPLAPLPFEEGNLRRELLCACPYFAAERVETAAGGLRETGARSFHLLLGIGGSPRIVVEDAAATLAPGQAVLITGESGHYTAEGAGAWLDYYVPDLDTDLREPLRRAGHSEHALGERIFP